MFTLPFKPYSNFFYGMHGSRMEALPSWGGGAQGSGQISLALNTFNGNFFIKTTPLLIEDLGGPIDLSYCFNSRTPNLRSKWHLSCLSEIVEQNTGSITIIESDGSAVNYNQIDSTTPVFYAPKNSPHAGAACHRKDDSGFEWFHPTTGDKRTYCSRGYLLETTDAQGHTLKYTYDVFFLDSLLACITSSSGHEYHFSWKTQHACDITLKSHQDKTEALLACYTFSDTDRQQLAKIEIKKGPDFYATKLSYEHDLLSGITQDDGTSIQLVFNPGHQLVKLALGNGPSYVVFTPPIPDAPRVIRLESEERKADFAFIHDAYGRYDSVSYHVPDDLGVDAMVESTAFMWDDTNGGVLKRILRMDNSYREMSYDINGNIIEISEYDASNICLTCKTFGYSAQGVLIATSDLFLEQEHHAQETTHFVYDFKADNTRDLTFVVHPGGHVEYFTYDEHRLLDKHHRYFSFFDGEPTLNALRDWQSALTPDEQQRVLLTSYKHNERGQVISKSTYQNTDATIYQQTFSKTMTGALLTHSRLNSMHELVTEVYERDAIDRVTSHKTPLSEETKTTYSKQTEVKIRPNNLIVTESYNASHHLMSRLYSNGREEVRDYTPSGQLSYLKTSEGLTTHYFYNKKDECIYELNGAGELTAYAQDHVHHVFSTTRFATRYENDDLDIALIEQFAKAHVNDSDNRCHQQIKDCLDRVIFELETCDERGYVNVVEFKYNSLGEKTKTIAYANSVTPEEARALLSSHVMPEHRKTVSDRTSRQIFQHSKLIAQVDAAGYVVLNHYNGAGLIHESVMINQPLSTTEQEALGANPTTLQLDDQIGARTLYFYDAAGNQTMMIDALGYVTAYEYDLNGQKSGQRCYATALDVADLTVDITPQLPRATDEDDHIVYIYDLNGRCIQQKHLHEGYERIQAYDKLGHVVSDAMQAIQNIDGDKHGDTYRARETSYNDMGERIQSINPMVMVSQSRERSKQEHVEYVKRDKKGLVTITYDALGEATYYFYGKQNRLALTLSPAGVVTRYEYNAFGEVTCQEVSTHVINPSILADFFDLHKKNVEALMASLRDVDGHELRFVRESTVYNPLGLVTKTCDADGYRNIKIYNAFQEIKCEEQEREKAREDNPAVFLETRYMREKRGLITLEVTMKTDNLAVKAENKKYDDPRGNCTYSKKTDAAAYHKHYDLLGRLTHRSIEDIDRRTGETALVALEQKQWGAFSRMTQHTVFVDNGTVQSITYEHNRKERSMVKTQDKARETTCNNIFGDVIAYVNAKNLMTRYTHNALGEMASECIVWANRETTMRLAKVFDMAGRVTQLVENNALEQTFMRNPDGIVIKKESRSLYEHGTRVDNYKIDGLGRTVQHINPEGGICNYEYSDGGQLVLSVIDPHGLNIQTQATYNGLKQKVFESLSGGHDTLRYETQFRQDHLARSHAKIIDPQGLALTSSVVRNRADHIIQSIDGNGHASYRVVDGCGHPVLTISAMGIVQESRYNTAGKMTYMRRYQHALSLEQLSLFFSAQAMVECNKTQNWSELFAVLEDLASVDDKQLSISYHTNGKKREVLKHFHDHEQGQSKVYKYTYTYSVTGKMLSQLMQSDHEQDRQTFYFYDEADNQTLIISPLGLITENIFNQDGQIIHRIEYAEPLEDELHQQLKQGAAVLHDKIRTHKTKQPTQNLHAHYVFDAYRNPIFTVDNKGLVSRYCYDRNHHKVKTIHFARAFDLHTEADVSSIEGKLFEHYSLDSLSEADRVYQDVFDKAGRLVQEIDPHGMTDIFERDVADLIVAHTDRAGQKTTNEYDLAKRRIAEILPEAPVTDVFIEGEGEAAKLNFSSTKRRVRNTQQFDKTDKVIAKTHDADHDARTVKIHYDLDGRYTGTQVDQVEVDDKTNTPQYVMDRPITHQTLSSSVVLHASGKAMVEQDEEGAYSFKVYDSLDRLRYEINAVGLVTSYERNASGSPLKATEYATALVFDEQDFKRCVQAGVEASWIKKQIQALTTPDDRIKCYTYDGEGRLLQTMTGLRHYYDPSSGDFYQAHGLVKQNYDVFGRVIERLTLMDAGKHETWHKHYFWYERGQRHYVLEAESYRGSIKDADYLFKMTAIRYDVFGDPVLRHQYDEAIELHASRQELTLSSTLNRLPTAQNRQDRIHAYTFNCDGKETSVKLVNRTHEIFDAQGRIMGVMDDENDARKDIELECAYAPRGERVVTTNAQGDKQWAFIDARGLTFATVDLPVVSEKDAAGRAQLAYPLTYFYHNAHGEQVGSKELWYGADPTTLTHPYELPQALNEAVERDFLSLDLKDTRGLTKLEQKGTQKTGYSYTATKQKAREFVSRLSDIKNESRVIDEKRHTFNLAKRPVLEESYRGGKRIDHHSTSSQLNTWNECIEKAFLSAPSIKSITKWSQGHAWFSHQDKDLPILEFSNMVGDITLAVRAHDDDLSGFKNEEEAIVFIKQNRYKNHVLKDIKTYDFAHHVLKHEQPATANFEPIETQLFDVDVNVGFEFSDNSRRAISWRNIDADDAHLVSFIRIMKDGINMMPSANAYGVEKSRLDAQRNISYFDVNFLAEDAYDVEIFSFKEEHVAMDVPLSGVQPVFSGHYPIEIAGEEYRLLHDDEIDILNVHVRLRAGMMPHVSVRIELWDNLPALYQTAKLDVRVRNHRGVHYNLVNQAVPNQDDKSSIYAIDGHAIDINDFISLNLKPTSFQLTLENHTVIKIGTDLRTINKAKPGETGDYGLRNYVYMRDCNGYGLSKIKIKIGNTVYRLSDAESDSIHQGKVIDITGQRGVPKISNPDRKFHAVSTPRWSQTSEKPRRTNRIVSSTFDVFDNNTTFVNERGHVWQKKYNAYNRVLETLDPEISSMVAPTDTKQGDLTYVAQTTQRITQHGYNLNGEEVAYAEGFNHETFGATMKPASTIERAPNGQSLKEVDACGVVTRQTFYSAMKLPVSVLTEGLSQPLRISYQGKHAQDVLFSGANVGLYMSNQALLYRMYRDPLTHEIIGLGVPRAAGAENASFAIASARYDDLGQIHARALPEGQISQFKKDTMGNVLTATTPLSTTTYQRQPFSGLIQHIGDSTANGNWNYVSNRLNLVVTQTQHGRVHTQTRYNAELLASTHCLNADTLSEYAYDNAGNLTQLMRTMQGVKATMTASYNAVHHLLLTDSAHFTQRYTPDPFYNQVMSELVFNMDGGPAKYTSISLGYSFDDSHRIVRNSVPCSWLRMASSGLDRCGFMAHMPTFKQGGIRVYDPRGNLASEAFELNKYAVTYERDALARISKVNYYGRGGGSKYLRYDAKGPVRYSVLKQDIQSNTLSEKHVRALNDAQNEAFRNGSLVIEARNKSQVDFVHQLRHGFEYDLNFTTRFTEDTFTSVFNSTINILNDGLTVQKTFSQVRDKSWTGASIYDYEYKQDYFCYQSIMVLPTRFYSRERRVNNPWGVEGQNTVSYSGSQAVGMQGDGDKVLTTQLSGFEHVHRVTHTDRETLIRKFPQFKSKRHPERLSFYNKQSVHFMTGIHDEYLGSVATTPIQENAWRTTVDSLSPDDAFCLSKPHYTSNIFHGEYVIDPFREPVTRDPDVHEHGEVKVSAATGEIQRNTRYSARLKRDFASGVASSFEQGMKIADPVNEVSVVEAALAPPSWVPLEKTLHISDPMFAHLPAYQKAMLPFIADEKGNLPSGLLLAISQGVMNHLKMGTKASSALAVQQAMQLGAPHAKPYHKKSREYFLEIFVTILVTMIIAAIATPAAGVLFCIEEGATATALEVGLTTSLLDVALKGAAYKTHLISHYSLVDSVGVGLSAGVGYGLGVLGPHSTAGLKEVLAYAVANNIETQLTEMAKHHQDGLNIRSLLSCVVTTLARQSVGFRLDVLDGPLGRTAESGQGMLEMLLLDFLGATITGQEVNLKYAVFNSLTSAMMSEVIHAVQADMPSMTPQAKEDKLKGGRNLPPHSKPESQRLGSSQKRYNEKQHQKAILASYGHLPAANDAFFKESVKEFMSDMRHDMSLDFDAETGHLIFDPLENHLHSSHVRVSASNSGMHSKTTTGQHQQAREHHARARAVPGKPGDSFGGSGLGLFSKPAPSTKPSGFMDYVDGVLVARDSTIGMFKQIVSHPLDTASAPFVGAWNVAHHPKYSYHHAVESTKDFTEHFANASGAERLGVALGFVGSGIYGAAFGAGTLPVFGAAAKYGQSLTSRASGFGRIRSVDSSLRLHVENNIVENKLSRETSKFLPFSRRATARGHYASGGWTSDRITSHLDGIDFSRRITEEVIPKGTALQQHQMPGDPIGNYFTLFGADRARLGIYTSGRTTRNYVATRDITALSSTTAGTTDVWSMMKYNWEIMVNGGETQYFTHNIVDWRLTP